MGQSLKNFFTALRMNAATELLRQKSVTEVSDILGYSSIHAFTRAYKALCGETPGSAKEKLNKNSISKYL
jgi:AraC-like DNA-binding protein